jgi:PEP-CTERM motif
MIWNASLTRTIKVGFILPALMTVLLASHARSDVIIDTTGSATGEIIPFGVPNTATYGQLVTVPSAPNTDLVSFGFLIDGPNTETFKTYVYAWDGSEATGSALYTSAVQTLTGAGESLYTSTIAGGLNLTAGEQYVLFASVSEVYTTSVGTATWFSAPDSAYPGGSFVFLNNGSDTSQWTSTPWTNVTALDSGFTAHFASTSVPEPSSIVMAGLGGLGLLACARRRYRRSV